MAISKIPSAGISNASNFRNIIINGDMSIAQRATSTASITSTGYYTLDRWNLGLNSMGTFTQSQSTDVPSGQGFANSLKMDCTTADASPAAGDLFLLQHKMEGQNLQYLKKGTSSAESLTVSFWVKSNKTGTYICQFRDIDNSRSISKSYTIDSASTWEKKTITYAGDTTGAFDNDNGDSLRLVFWLGAGSNYSSGTLATTWGTEVNANRAVGQVNLADNTANEFYITGVQLEAGTSASDFEFLPYDVNLQRCQRYYYALLNTGEDNNYFISGYYYTGSFIYCHTEFPTTMRASPSLVQSSGTDYYTFYSNGAGDGFDSFNYNITFLTRNATFGNNTQVSGTGGNAGRVYSTNTNSYVHFNAEL